MGASRIEWTEAVWNPVTGCTPVSEGCRNCYARRMATRLRGRFGYPADDPFRVTLHMDRLHEPLGWRKPRRVFVASMGDLFHPDVPAAFISDVFTVMRRCPQHCFLVLTKRPERMQKRVSLMSSLGELRHVWLGFSAENQETFDARWTHMLPLAQQGWRVWVSLEPLLGLVNLVDVVLPRCLHLHPDNQPGCSRCRNFAGLNWCVVGGESGPGARPMHPDWVRAIRDQCVAAGVPFFFKQWGDYYPLVGEGVVGTSAKPPQAAYVEHGGRKVCMVRVDKKAAGRMLDGRVWNQCPEAS